MYSFLSLGFHGRFIFAVPILPIQPIGFIHVELIAMMVKLIRPSLGLSWTAFGALLHVSIDIDMKQEAVGVSIQGFIPVINNKRFWIFCIVW